MAAVVRPVEGFEPSRRFFTEIPQAGHIIGQHGTDGSGQEQGKGHGSEGRRAKQNEKNDQRDGLIGSSHGEQAGEFRFPVRRGVDPVTDAGVPVGNGIEGQMTEERDGKRESRRRARPWPRPSPR